MTSVRQDVNTSWKIRGFSSVDMTSQTQIFFFFFLRRAARHDEADLLSQQSRGGRRRSPRPFWVTQWCQGHCEMCETLSQTKKRGSTQTWGYYRSTSVNKKKMFHGNQQRQHGSVIRKKAHSCLRIPVLSLSCCQIRKKKKEGVECVSSCFLG